MARKGNAALNEGDRDNGAGVSEGASVKVLRSLLSSLSWYVEGGLENKRSCKGLRDISTGIN
jgi:hypothetical protein